MSRSNIFSIYIDPTRNKKLKIKHPYSILERVSNYLQTLEPLSKCTLPKITSQDFLYHIKKSSGFLMIQVYFVSKVERWKSLLLVFRKVLCKTRGVTNLYVPVTFFLEKISYWYYAYLTPKWFTITFMWYFFLFACLDLRN